MGEERKIVLFIVEGVSDKSALENIFRKVYRRNRKIDFKFTNGDISSDPDVTKENVEDRISEVIESFIDDKKLRKSDIYQVIQIFDMDGAYIPDSAKKNGKTSHFVYSLEGISCNNIEKVRDRNKQKTMIMDYLLSRQEIDGLPYEMYFMSCNLDHALYNEMNLNIDEKKDYADAFYERFIGKEEMFIDFLNTDVVNGVPDSLKASWTYIKEDLHSLERHTNLNLYFVLHPKPDGLL